MLEALIETVLKSEGVWAAFAVALVFYVMAASARREALLLENAEKRENLLMGFLNRLAEKFGKLAEQYHLLNNEIGDIKRDLHELKEMR